MTPSRPIPARRNKAYGGHRKEDRQYLSIDENAVGRSSGASD
jgi:hypothetical protein